MTSNDEGIMMDVQYNIRNNGGNLLTKKEHKTVQTH